MKHRHRDVSFPLAHARPIELFWARPATDNMFSVISWIVEFVYGAAFSRSEELWNSGVLWQRYCGYMEFGNLHCLLPASTILSET